MNDIPAMRPCVRLPGPKSNLTAHGEDTLIDQQEEHRGEHHHQKDHAGRDGGLLARRPGDLARLPAAPGGTNWAGLIFAMTTRSSTRLHSVLNAAIPATRSGRSGGARTPNPRFWRPVLYQLSYTPRPGNRAASESGVEAPDRPCLPRNHASYHLLDDRATTPAPTVRPPSRMAKRSPSSMAIGAISVTTIDTLSPGITISVPSGRSTSPVTSVVRK